METMKTFLRVICIFCFLQLLVMGVSASVTGTLQLQGDESYYIDDNSIPAGTYSLQYRNSISTLVHSDNTTISNITYSLGIDNMEHVIYIQDSQYATTNSTEITWVFPDSIVVNNHARHLVEIKTDSYSSQYLPMTLSRTMNQTQFSGEGYQKASFTVSFENITYAYENRLCDSIWTGFGANENKNLNATFLLDTFSTDAPGTYNVDRHSFSFNWDRSNIALNRVYNFSIAIRVVPNGTSPVIFKPYFGVVLFNGNYRTSATSGTSTTMPEDMLPPHLTYATASQNLSLTWGHYLLFGKGAHFNETKTKVSSAPVASFSGTPTTGTAPLTVTFTDTSTNSPTSWNWDFGDGSYSTEKNPSHTYSSVGTYNVALTATNSAGSNTLTRTNYITVTAAAGVDNVGIFRDGVFYRNGADAIVYGLSTDTPVIGDWNGDHISEVGVYRGGVFYLNGAGYTVYGLSTDTPVIGDWNGDGLSEVGVFRDGVFYRNGAEAIVYGLSTDTPVIGKWTV